MQWEKFTELVKLVNNSTTNEDYIKLYQFVIENISELDKNSIEVILEGIELTDKHLIEYSEYMKIIYEYFKTLSNTTNFGLRTGLRFEMFIILYDNTFN